jgi:hypothetical protein
VEESGHVEVVEEKDEMLGASKENLLSTDDDEDEVEEEEDEEDVQLIGGEEIEEIVEEDVGEDEVEEAGETGDGAAQDVSELERAFCDSLSTCEEYRIIPFFSMNFALDASFLTA